MAFSVLENDENAIRDEIWLVKKMEFTLNRMPLLMDEKPPNEK